MGTTSEPCCSIVYVLVEHTQTRRSFRAHMHVFYGILWVTFGSMRNAVLLQNFCATLSFEMREWLLCQNNSGTLILRLRDSFQILPGVMYRFFFEIEASLQFVFGVLLRSLRLLLGQTADLAQIRKYCFKKSSQLFRLGIMSITRCHRTRIVGIRNCRE